MTTKKPRSGRNSELVREERSKPLPRKRSARTNPGSAVSESSNHAPSDDEIARKAYALWEFRGRPIGSPDEDWFRAKDVLTMKATA